jgi:hypothetical protein
MVTGFRYSPLVLSVVAALVGCDDSAEENTSPDQHGDTGADVAIGADRDLDGFLPGTDDCDDTNSSIHPGARERSFDGVDSDCDGQDMPAMGENRYAEAVGIMDTDDDGSISFAEFSAACERSSQLDSATARPGVVLVHASCSGTVACRGMHLHPWNELFAHDCRGVNYCTGWSCVETAADEGLNEADAYVAGGCTNCHAAGDGEFKVLVPPGEDVDAAVATFLDRSDDELLSAVAFGIRGINPSGTAHVNMPGHYETLSRREMEGLIAHMRSLTLVGENFDYGENLTPNPP